jgi:hypothetical protein
VTIGIGRINALTGGIWDGRLHASPQNYIVCPEQPWLDGINVGDGIIRQFVAMPLGMGYAVEAQVTGTEEFGGIQIRVYEPKAGIFPDRAPAEAKPPPGMLFGPAPAPRAEMGLGAGGKIRQKIYPDAYGIETWDPDNYGDLFVHIVNSEQYHAITEMAPPPSPISASTYNDYGLPWFDLYDEAKETLTGSETMRRIRTIRERDAERGEPSESRDESVEIEPSKVKKLHHGKPSSDEQK